MTDRTRTYAEGIELTAEVPDEFAEILTPEAVAFVAKLSREQGGRPPRQAGREAGEDQRWRDARLSAGDAGGQEGDWKIAPSPTIFRTGAWS